MSFVYTYPERVARVHGESVGLVRFNVDVGNGTVELTLRETDMGLTVRGIPSRLVVPINLLDFFVNNAGAFPGATFEEKILSALPQLTNLIPAGGTVDEVINPASVEGTVRGVT